MSTEKNIDQKPAQAIPPKAPIAPKLVENSTDATRGEPLGMRAQKRRAELIAAKAKVPATELRTIADFDTALMTVDDLLTGDLEHLSETTASDLNRWLETTKHLAETPKTAGKH